MWSVPKKALVEVPLMMSHAEYLPGLCVPRRQMENFLVPQRLPYQESAGLVLGDVDTSVSYVQRAYSLVAETSMNSE
jgi:hypothetical protein